MLSNTDRFWPKASAWVEGKHFENPLGTIGLLGVPLSKGSITHSRCDLAPSAIRSALQKFSTYDFNIPCDLRAVEVVDLGDLDVVDDFPEAAERKISGAVRTAMQRSDVIVALGGDNSVTRPVLLGITDSLEECGLITLDAHLDLRDLEGGLTNGNPIRALLADGFTGSHIVQIGIQSFANSQAYAQVAHEAGIVVHTVEEIRRRGIDVVLADALARLSATCSTIYVDLDLDVLDRSFAPATAGSRPGGLAPWEILLASRVCGLHSKVHVLDLVEIDPSSDVSDTTIFSAAACFLSFAAGFRARFDRKDRC